MSILGFSNSNMMSENSQPFFNGFKKQASFYIKEKIKTARLALTDVTPAQLMTEEATSGNPWAPDAKTMNSISRAAFEVDDYWRIVEILHQRLANFDKKNWRPSYNALILLEHLMTHGPDSVAKEFQDDISSIRKMQSFHHVDEKGFNWGLAVRKKSERVVELLQKKPLLKQERDRAREVTRGIQGFGSFSKRKSSSPEEGIREMFGRSHSQFNEHSNHVDEDGDSNILPSTENRHDIGKVSAVESPASVVVNERVSSKENMAPVRGIHGWNSSESGEMNSLLSGGRRNKAAEEEEEHVHPFGAIEKQSKVSLLGGDW